MNDKTKTRLRALMLKSKMGQNLTDDEFSFIGECYSRWPDEYRALHEEVRDEAFRRVTGMFL